MRHRVARLDEVPEGRGLRVEVAGRELALYRRGDEVFALEDVCPHRGAGLADGEVRDGVVFCPIHAWSFELATGRCAEPGGAFVQTFWVIVEGGEIHVEL